LSCTSASRASTGSRSLNGRSKPSTSRSATSASSSWPGGRRKGGRVGGGVGIPCGKRQDGGQGTGCTRQEFAAARSRLVQGQSNRNTWARRLVCCRGSPAAMCASARRRTRAGSFADRVGLPLWARFTWTTTAVHMRTVGRGLLSFW
jgi:hypothetical protein